MTHKAAEYRKRARDARERAAWLSHREARERLLELALHLDLLAETEERRGLPSCSRAHEAEAASRVP